jgi:hypothetical protein
MPDPLKQADDEAKYPRQGSNSPTESAGKQHDSQSGGAKSGANEPKSASLPPDLAELLMAWPALPDAIKTGIMAMIRSAAR